VTAVDPSLWGLERHDGRLHLDGHDLCALAAEHGTPLHVASARTLRARARELQRAFHGYPAPVRAHYSYKTNPVAGVLQVLHDAGMGAEVVDGYELWLASQLGVPGEDIVFNGANKSEAELNAAIEAEVGLLVVDSLVEIERVEALAAAADRVVPIGLRVCPDVKPRGVPVQAAAGARRNLYGLDLQHGEVDRAIQRAVHSPHLRLRGTMAHIGTGIHDLDAYRRSVRRLVEVQLRMLRAGAEPDVIDVGGGLATRLARSFHPLELLRYYALGRCPSRIQPAPADLFDRYASALGEGVERASRELGLEPPALILEPGRAVSSDGQLLLLRVGTIKDRRGVGRFVLVDGGAMTVSMMFLVEYHAVFLANRDAPARRRVDVFGRLPTQLDVLYRGMKLPPLAEGDVLAVMNSGAYFTATATNFGGPRPGVLLLDGPEQRMVRRHETHQDLAAVELVLPGPEARP
jgi:diaminopimelate decarboxylase